MGEKEYLIFLKDRNSI